MSKDVNKSNFSSTAQLTSNESEKFSTTIYRKLVSLKNYITVEPFLLCYFLPSIISTVAVQQLNLEKACRANLNISQELCTAMLNGEAPNITEPLVMVARMSSWQTPLSSAIPAIMILPVGAWSDRSGNRKLLMLCAIFGQLISSLGLLLATYYFLEWPLFITALIEALPTALTGGFSITIMAAFSFIADVTTIEERTLRFGIVSIIVTLSIPIATSISGILTICLGYFGIFGMASLMYLLGFFYVLFRIHDVKKDNIITAKDKSLLSIFNPLHVKGVWDVFVRKRNGSKRICVFLLVIVHIVIIGPIQAEAAVLFPYVLNKYGFTVIDYSELSTFTTIMGLIGTSVAITIFSKMLKMDDSLLGIIATLSKILSSIVYAFAPNWQWLYVAPVIDIFGNSGATAIRSLGTKMVEPSEVGKMASIIGFAEALSPIAYAPLYSNLYASNINTFPGVFFLLGGAMTVPAIFIFMYMFLEWKKDIKADMKTNVSNGNVVEISHL